MRINEFDNEITSSDLEALETFADRIFAKVGIDVEFTRHFLDRVNDERNGKQITASELTRLFKQEYKRWGQPIAQMGPDAEAVMKDLATDINMPFALRWDKENEELDLIVKTVMRKPDFKTSNREFPVESSGSLDSYYEMMRAKEMAEEDGLDSRNLSYGVLMDYIKKARIEREKKNEGRGLFSMGGRSGLRHSPTIRSRTSSASFLPKAGKKPSLLKRIFSDEFSESNESEEDCTACNGTGWERVSSDEDERGCDDCGGTGKIKIEEHNVVKGSDPWPKAKAGRTDHPFRGRLVGSKFNEESQIWKFNKEDPNNPEVLIQGFGRLMLNQIEDSVVGKLEDLLHRAKSKDWQQIDSLLGRDVMQIMIKAIVDTKKDLEATRKRGGPKSRGINKDINYESKERTSILDVIGESKIEDFEKDFSKLNEFTLSDVKDMIKKGWMARPTEKQWKELRKTYNKYKGNVTRKDLIDVGVVMLGRKESVKEKQEKTDDELKAFDPKTARAVMMLKAKYPQADNILSALLADVENNEKDSDVADLSQELKMEKLTTAVAILQREINLLKRKQTNETGGVGKIVPGINTSVDVGPNEIKKQAAKFGNDVDKDGVPKKNLR